MQNDVYFFIAFEIIALPTIYDAESEYTGFRGIIAGYGKFGDCKNNVFLESALRCRL